jgi:predicted metal-dependent phosphoesterase TrpH
MALTDHDTTDGLPAFFAACAREGEAVRLGGIELSVASAPGYGRFHLLGLGIDPHNARLCAFLETIRCERDARNEKIIANLAAQGYVLSPDEVKRQAAGPVIARPHIARALMARGWATSIPDAFSRLIGDGAPAYVPRMRPPPEEAIAVIHDAGGVAVMAHPRYWTDSEEMLARGLTRLRDAGLDGLETRYQANTPDETILHVRTARRLGLLETAGSDFHGANKPAVTLGMAVGDEQEMREALLARVQAYQRSPDLVK